ncbi:unnamed protein product [Cunninghamella blakesleeana]
MDIPEDLKYITPFIQRGQELATREPIISYYAQYYAVKLAISRGPSNKATNGYLSHLLDTLEEKKKALGTDNEVITNDLVGYAHVENFALKVFLSADNEDRSGNATKKTAKTFLASSVFLELLKVFGDVDPEIEGKIKYSKWKAADIMKAIREGRTPTPGAPGENTEDDETETTMDPNLATTADVDSEDPSLQSQPQPPPAISDFPSPPSNFSEPFSGASPKIINNRDIHIPPSPQLPSHSSSTSVPSAPSPSSISPNISTTTSIHPINQNSISNITPSSSTSRVPPPSSSAIATAPTADLNVSSTTTLNANSYNQTIGSKEIEAAQKSAKWAISALNYDDIATARLQLLNALNDLGFNQQNNFGY